MIDYLTVQPFRAEGDASDAVAAKINAVVGWDERPTMLLTLGDRLTLAMGGSTAAQTYLDGLLTTLAADASPSSQMAYASISSGRAVVYGPAIRGKLQSTFAPDQLAPLIALLRTAPLVTAADVDAAIAGHALTLAKSATLAALETYASSVRTHVGAAADVASLPSVPDPLPALEGPPHG